MGVVSSEEIAAALELAGLALAAVNPRLEWFIWTAPEEETTRAAKTLTAHLTRLREEAAFVRLAKVWCATYDRQHAMALPSDEHADMMSAYRALEEPRDG